MAVAERLPQLGGELDTPVLIDSGAPLHVCPPRARTCMYAPLRDSVWSEKAGPDGVPQKGSVGMIITDIVDDNVQDYVRDFCAYVRRFCLELAQPI